MENSPSIMDPNYIPEDLKSPYDVVDLPSQGLLYSNKKSKVKVEYLTAMDESILTSPNLTTNPAALLNTLLKRKVKDLGFDPENLIEGDRTALIVFLRATGLGEKYKQLIYDEDMEDFVEGEIDLTTLKQKKLEIRPDENNEFDFILPLTGKKIKFKFLTGKDEKEIDEMDALIINRSPDKISEKLLLRVEKAVTEIDGERDKIKLSNILKHIPIKDSRSLRKYISDNEPGLDFNTQARTPGGASVPCFLRFNTSFFWPEL